KLGLFGALLLLGGLNLFVLSRRLRVRTNDERRTTNDERRTTNDERRTMRSRLSSIVRRQKADRIPDATTIEPSVARGFGRSVRWELLAGALLLLAVGAMTSVAPSQTAWEAHQRLGLSQEASDG